MRALAPSRLRCALLAVLFAGAICVPAMGVATAVASPADAAACTPTATLPGDQTVGVSPTDDACGSFVAVSGTGNATTTGPCDFGLVVQCAAISGTGNATNNAAPVDAPAACSPTIVGGTVVGCLAASGTGNATNNAGGPEKGGCDALGVVELGCVAASGTGNATNNAGDFGCFSWRSGVLVGCLAVSGTGNATNNATGILGGCTATAVVSDAGATVGCLAVSGTGNATNNTTGTYGGCDASVLYSDIGAVVGCVAVSGTGEATNNAAGASGAAPLTGGCQASGRFDNLPLGLFIGCLALSLTGTATNYAPPDGCPQEQVNAIGCLALSGRAP